MEQNIKGRHRLYYINAEKRREIKLRYTLLLIVFYGYVSEHYSFFDIYYIRGMFNIEIFKYIQYQHAFGAWNIAISICEIYASYDIKSKASMFVSKWEKSLVIILIVCILNLLIGNYIGFVLNLHMLYIRHIINKNKMLLISI